MKADGLSALAELNRARTVIVATTDAQVNRQQAALVNEKLSANI